MMPERPLKDGLRTLREFAFAAGVNPVTVTQVWALYGQAPKLIRISNRLYLTDAEWRDWFARRDALRKLHRKPWLRAPAPTTPRPRKGKREGK